MAVWESFPSPDPAANPPALAEVAEMLRETGREESAASTYDWLRRRFGNVVCREGKTAEQLINDLPADNGILKLLDRKDPWPVGNVENAAKEARNSMLSNSGRLPVEFKGMPGPYFENVNLTFDQNRRELTASDGLGNDLWKIVLHEDRPRRQQYNVYNPGIAHARALGHLLLFSAGGSLFAIDTLRAGEKNPPKILWSQSMADISGDPADMQPIFPQGAFAGVMQMRMMQMYNQNHDLEAATDRYVCVQRSRSLIALDPFTGATLWVRQDIPQGSVVFGDDEYVFVLPPDKPEALVLRALDGEQAGTRKIPRTEISVGNPGGQMTKSYSPLGDTCPIALGRNLLFWRLEENRHVLELFDPWTQKPVWPRREFSFHAQYSILGNELIGILEPKGEFVLLNLPDGRPIAELNLKAQPYLAELTLIAWENQYLVLAHDSYQDPNAPQLRPVAAATARNRF